MGFFKKLTSDILGEDVAKYIPSGSEKKKSSLDTPEPPKPAQHYESLSVLVGINGEQYGPYERPALLEMIQNGTLTPETYVFMEGMSEWAFARDVPRVSALFGTSSPVAPAPPMPFAAPKSATPAMASSGMSAKLDMLVESAIADGTITDLERQVLIRNAQQEGIDIDEFCVIVDARLFQKQKELKAEANAHQVKMAQAQATVAVQATAAPKPSNKYGEVRKCPVCDAVIPSAGMMKCPECGYEFSGIKKESCIQDLLAKLEKVEMDAPEKSGGAKLVSIFADALNGGDKETKQKHTIIRTYPIPDTKGEILDFLSIAVPLAQVKGNFFTKDNPENESHNSMQPAWRSKCEQIIIKARFLMKDDPKTLAEIEEYAKILKIK